MKGELAVDPRGLILEAYRMDVGPEDCRTIFLDWATGHATPVGPAEVGQLLAAYGALHPDHPMTDVLREGMTPPRPPRRPRGRRARIAAKERPA